MPNTVAYCYKGCGGWKTSNRALCGNPCNHNKREVEEELERLNRERANKPSTSGRPRKKKEANVPVQEPVQEPVQGVSVCPPSPPSPSPIVTAVPATNVPVGTVTATAIPIAANAISAAPAAAASSSSSVAPIAVSSSVSSIVVKEKAVKPEEKEEDNIRWQFEDLETNESPTQRYYHKSGKWISMNDKNNKNVEDAYQRFTTDGIRFQNCTLITFNHRGDQVWYIVDFKHMVQVKVGGPKQSSSIAWNYVRRVQRLSDLDGKEGKERVTLRKLPPTDLFYQTPEIIERYEHSDLTFYEDGGPVSLIAKDFEKVATLRLKKPKSEQEPSPKRPVPLNPLETSSLHDVITGIQTLNNLVSVTRFDGNIEFDYSNFPPLLPDSDPIIPNAKWQQVPQSDAMYWEVYSKLVNDSTKTYPTGHHLLAEGFVCTKSYNATILVFRNCHIQSFAMYKAFRDQCLEREVRYLWHGTKTPVEVSEGFDRSFCMRIDSVNQYGIGTYFTADPMYAFANKFSGSYSSSTYKYLLLCRVTLGDCPFVQEDKLQTEYQRKPLTMQSIRHPGMRVNAVKTFGQGNWIYLCPNDFQAFPEFVVCFKR